MNIIFILILYLIFILYLKLKSCIEILLDNFSIHTIKNLFKKVKIIT